MFKMKRLWLIGLLLSLGLTVPNLLMAGSLKGKIQQQVDSSNIQYEPYYLQSNYPVQNSEQGDEYWGKDKSAEEMLIHSHVHSRW